MVEVRQRKIQFEMKVDIRCVQTEAFFMRRRKWSVMQHRPFEAQPQLDLCRNQSGRCNDWHFIWLHSHPLLGLNHSSMYHTAHDHSISFRAVHGCGFSSMRGKTQFGGSMTEWFYNSQVLPVICFVLFPQTTYPTWSVPCTLSSNSPPWLTVSHQSASKSNKLVLFLFSSCNAS